MEEDKGKAIKRSIPLLSINPAASHCLLIEGDLRRSAFATEIVKKTLEQFGRIDTLIHNQAVAFYKDSMDISDEQMEDTFRTNTFPLFYLTKAALTYMKPDSTIISTASITAYEGWPFFLDYAASKGALISFTRALSKQLVDRGIRVNTVAPGPVWTPLIVASYPADQVKIFGLRGAHEKSCSNVRTCTYFR